MNSYSDQVEHSHAVNVAGFFLQRGVSKLLTHISSNLTLDSITSNFMIAHYMRYKKNNTRQAANSTTINTC